MKDETYFSTIEDFSNTSPAYKLILKSIRELIPNKNNWFGSVFSCIIGLVLGVVIGWSDDTVALSLKACDIIFGVQLSIFACVFAVYSILLAFLSDSYIKKLLKIDYEDGTSYLITGTGYYESILFLYFVAILLSLIVKLFLSCIADDFLLTQLDCINNALAILLLSIYFSFSLRIVYELKSIIYNTIVLFRASIAYKILAFDAEEKENEVDEYDKD